MPNRRIFLQTLVAAATGATAFVALQGETAERYLTREWNAYMRGRSLRDGYPQIAVGKDLFDAFERELVSLRRSSTAYVEPKVRTLAFKSARLITEGRGWRVKRIDWIGA